MKKEFVVIWNKIETKFIEYENAIEYAKYVTKDEKEHFTALIIKREINGDNVKIPLMMGCTWIIENVFELVNLTM